MTLTIKLPLPVQAALEADAKAQARPVADVLAEKLIGLYAIPVTGEEERDEEAAKKQRWLLNFRAWQAEGREPNQDAPPKHTDPHEIAFGEIITEKFRKQGFNL